MGVYVFSITWSVLVGLFIQCGKGLNVYRREGKVWVFDKDNIMNAFLVFLSALPCTFFSAMRVGIGTDYYYAYYPSFYNIANGKEVFSEWGFNMLNRAILLFTDNVQYLFIVTSVLTAYWIFSFIYKESENFAMSVYLMFVSQFYFVSLNNVRQCMSFAISAYALSKLEEKKIVAFIFWNIISGLIHQTGYLYLLLYFATKIKINIRVILIFLGISAIMGSFVLRKLVEFFAANTKLGDYFKYSMYTNGSIPIYCTLLQLLVLGFILYSRWINHERLKEGDDIYIIIQIGAAVVCFGNYILPAAYRFLRLFSFFQMVSIPNYIAVFERREERWLWSIVLLAAITYLCIMEIVIQGYEAVVPYQMFQW